MRERRAVALNGAYAEDPRTLRPQATRSAWSPTTVRINEAKEDTATTQRIREEFSPQ
jgi:hypothetical protein